MSEACTVETLQGEVATLERDLKESRYDVAMLQLKVDDLLRRLYGHSSEKLAPGQLDLLGDAPQQDDEPDDTPDDDELVSPHATTSKQARESPASATRVRFMDESS